MICLPSPREVGISSFSGRLYTVPTCKTLADLIWLWPWWWPWWWPCEHPMPSGLASQIRQAGSRAHGQSILLAVQTFCWSTSRLAGRQGGLHQTGQGHAASRSSHLQAVDALEHRQEVPRHLHVLDLDILAVGNEHLYRPAACQLSSGEGSHQSQPAIQLGGCQTVTSCPAWQAAASKATCGSGQCMLGFSCHGDREQTGVSKAAEQACVLQGSTKANCRVSN